MHINDNQVDIGVLNGQANAYLEQGRYDVAIHLFHHLIEHIRDIPELVHSLARIYVNLGIAYRKIGQLEQAATVTEAGLMLEAENDGEPRTIAIFLLNLAQLRADQDRLAEALDLTRQARAIIEQIGDELLHAECLYVLGNHLLLNGYTTEATQIYGLTIQLASRTQNEIIIARAQFSLARMLERQGDFEGAWALGVACTKLFEAYGLRDEMDNTLRFLKRLHLQRDADGNWPDQRK
jgi:tetratricopeptide (TPR) repeat protein